MHQHEQYCEGSATCSRGLQHPGFLRRISQQLKAVEGLAGQHVVRAMKLQCNIIHWQQASGSSGGPHLRCGEREADARRAQRVEDAQLPAHGHDAVPGEGVRAAERPAVHRRLRERAISAAISTCRRCRALRQSILAGWYPCKASLPALCCAKGMPPAACQPACMLGEGRAGVQKL